MAERLSASVEDLYRRVRRLRIRVIRDVTTRMGGSYASAFRGPGMEFAELRHYQAGDDVRRMDWQVTARRREPYVRRYVEERELRVLIAMDVSASMGRSAVGSEPRATACEVAGTLALSAAWNGDRVGGLLFGAKVASIIAPRRGERHAMDVVRLAMSTEAGGNRTDLRPALDCVRNLHGHAIVFLFSDFITDPPPWDGEVRRLLAACARKHDLLAIRMQSQEARGLPTEIIVEGAETESGRMIWVDMFGRAGEGANASLARHGLLTARTLRGCAVSTVEVSPGEPYLDRLVRLFAQRRAGRRR